METSIKAADNIRLLCAAMVEKANSGHPGGPMGGADFMHVLYTEFLNYDPDEMDWFARDRFYLDAGHMSAMMYATQCLLGNYTMEDLRNFRQWHSPTPGHPEVDFKRGIENTSGPLGLGHAFGIGSAIAERFLVDKIGEAIAHKTYIYISDGGVQEEISQGAGRIAGHLGLGEIVMFYDANDIQLSTVVDAVTTEDTAMKYEAWHWHVLTIDGNDHDALRKAIQAGIDETEKPTLIIGKTTMGKGVRKESGDLYEGEVELHGKPLGKSNASFAKTVEGLGGKVEDPFEIFPDVKVHYTKVVEAKKAAAKERKTSIESYLKANPEKAAKLKRWIEGKLPNIDWGNMPISANKATRDSAGEVLANLHGVVDNLIVSSADLSNSDKTDKFLKKTTEMKKGDFSGSFLQAGVAELTMAALSTGMALHGGVVPVCATFFAFSDYMKPAVRVASLMEQQVIFVWTHDAFRVGEDGPTHQPVEQEAQLRLMEKLRNHSGKNGLLALRPADGAESVMSWKLALENTDSPTGLILSRQALKDLPAEVGTRFKAAEGTTKGAYVIKDEKEPQIILVANGSEVGTLFAGAELLEAKGIKCKIISAPSEGLFRNQDWEYQRALLPTNVPKFGLTAGLPVNLEGLVKPFGIVWGLEHFGHSAPATVLDEKFGFTAKNVCEQVEKLLGQIG